MNVHLSISRLSLTASFVLVYIGAYTLLIYLLNGGAPNRILTPLPQYYSLFSALWDENAWAATQLMIKKSFFIIAHRDPRSGLNLWTMEIDSVSIAVYFVIAWLLSGRLLKLRHELDKAKKSLLLSSTIAGSLLICFSISYMTVIDHCAGATWAGFVAIYGMGASEFHIYPAYQIIVAGVGIALLFTSYFILRRGAGNKTLDDVSPLAP